MTFNLNPLKDEEIRDFCLKLAELDNYSVIITLTSGELLFGDLRLEILYHDKKPDETLWYTARYDRGNGYLAVKLKPEFLMFNTADGTEFGDSHIITLKKELISGLSRFSWNANFVPLKGIPNPYAKLISDNNLKVANNNNLIVEGYSEFSLSSSKLSSKGIEFHSEELIYTDWDFIKIMAGGTDISMGAVGIGLRPERTI